MFNCSAVTWADKFHVNRPCTEFCTNDAVTKSYGHNSTRTCVEVCPDTEFGQIVLSVPVCLFIC